MVFIVKEDVKKLKILPFSAILLLDLQVSWIEGIFEVLTVFRNLNFVLFF